MAHAVLALWLALAAPQAPFGAPAAEIAAAVRASAPADIDGDGTAELRSLRTLGGAGGEGRSVVVLVEERLVAAAAPRAVELRERLERFACDLAAAGYRADLVVVEPYHGPRHQDGRIVLALRRLLQRCAKARPLAGAVLVGHFPDALLVRTCSWRRDDGVDLVDRAGHQRRFSPWLRRVPEAVAWCCDLVLADLDGDWEDRYFEGDTALPAVLAAFDGEVPQRGGEFAALQLHTVRFRDGFHVADGAVAVDEPAGTIEIDDDARDAECTLADRQRPNPLAQPEIAVSRLDARGVAWSPAPRFLGDRGEPIAVAFAAGETMPAWHDVWQPDPDLEARLLVDYLDRNHAFRTDPLAADADRPASAAHGLGSGMASARRARATWADFAADGYDLDGDCDLVDLLAWFRRPAVFRTLRAHSDPFVAAFARTDTDRLEAAIGGVPWSFTAAGRTLAPSLRAACAGGRADFFFYRTLWANHALPAQGYLLVHTGCEAIAPHGAADRSYDDPRYGLRQHAESILFFTPCLALIGRAKVFYDEPRGFSETLAAGGCMGDAWRRYFAIEADSSWAAAGGDIGRKRAAFWSLLGDFTLGLPR